MADRADASIQRELDKLKKAELIDIIINNKLPEGINNDLLNKYFNKHRVVNNSENNNIKESDLNGDKCDKLECVKTQYSERNLTNEKVLMENNIQLLKQRVCDLEYIITLLKSNDKKMCNNEPNQKISETPSNNASGSNLQQKSLETIKTNQSNITPSNIKTNQNNQTHTWQTVTYRNNRQTTRNKNQEVQKVADKNQHIFTAEEVTNAIRSTESHPGNRHTNRYTASHRKPIIGSNKNCSTVKAVPKLGYLHVYRLDPTTTPTELCNALSKTAPQIPFKCDILHNTEKTCSMMVTFPINHVHEVYDPEIWPNGALVKRFYFKNKNFPAQALEKQTQLADESN